MVRVVHYNVLFTIVHRGLLYITPSLKWNTVREVFTFRGHIRTLFIIYLGLTLCHMFTDWS